MRRFRLLTRLDWVLLAATALLIALGLLILYSSSIRSLSLSNEIDATRQILYAVVGILILIAFVRLDYRILRDYSTALYVIMLALLLAVNFFGKSAFGATRWITIGFFQFQPTEFAKLILIIVFARFFSKNYEQTKQWRVFAYSLMLLLPPLILVLLQPDLGSALVFIAIWLVMVLATKFAKRNLFYGAVVLALLTPIVIPHLLPYQRQRIKTLLDPTADPLGAGYNVTQAKIAVGSGGWLGNGLSAGSQSQLNFLPSQHTDFIFAVLAEKLGFVGSVLLLMLFVVLCIQIIKISLRAHDRFGSFLCIGVVGMFLFHVLINVGMNLGIMPVTGIPLPFLSAGGSAMLVALACIGIVESVAVRSSTRPRLDQELVG